MHDDARVDYSRERRRNEEDAHKVMKICGKNRRPYIIS